MKFLLTSGGITNTSIHNALEELLGKPIAESSALYIPTALYAKPIGPTMVARLIRGETNTAPFTIGFVSMCEVGWKSLGVLELTALPSIQEDYWVPLVQETDALLVEGGDPLYLCYWMRQSGLADLLPSLRPEAVYVGLSAGSMVMAPTSGRTSSAGSRSPVAIERWDWWILRCFRTWITPLCRTIPWPTLKNGPPVCRCRRT
jgi:dipeptidase E